MGRLCHCPSIVWELFWKWADMQLVREHSSTVVSTRWVTVDWSGIKSGISVHELTFTLKKNSAGREWMVEHSPKIWACKDEATTTRFSTSLGWCTHVLTMVHIKNWYCSHEYICMCVQLADNWHLAPTARHSTCLHCCFYCCRLQNSGNPAKYILSATLMEG